MIKIFYLLILIFFYACKQPVQVKGPPGYALSSPETFKMPEVLNEISGIALSKGNPDTLYAEQDEEGKLYYLPTVNLDVKHQKFGKKGDYEDIAICNGTVVLLRSDGVLFSFPLATGTGDEAGNVQETAGLLPGGEYEAMYADENSSDLYVLCKKCDSDDGGLIHGYILQMTTGNQISLKTSFQVNTKDIAARLHQKKINFRPSALAKNNNNRQWYILSSVDKLMIVTDEQWVIKDVYPLDPALFNQPEGIAFDKDYNLYISNERGSATNATVLKFILKK